jgi:hypothetical protein
MALELAIARGAPSGGCLSSPVRSHWPPGAWLSCGIALRGGVSVWVPDVAVSPIFSPAAARVMLDAGAAAVGRLM